MHGRGFSVLVGIGLLCSSIEVEAQDHPAGAHHCEVTGCGSNTPDLFGTPIIGLNLQNVRNSKGVTLDPVLTRVQPLPPWPVADCPPAARLGVEQGRLVGKDATGKVVCEGSSMLGMAFGLWVEKTSQKKAAYVHVRISEAGQVWTWELPPPPLAVRTVPTYRLVWHDVAGAAEVLGTTTTLRNGDSICPRREAWMEDWQKSSSNPTSGTPSGWKDTTDHLLIVQGETYRDDASPDPISTRDGKDWINLACVGTSIAKMRLLGFDPMRSPGKNQALMERIATLKMLTGRYFAGDAAQTSYTKPGMPLLWKHRDGRVYEGGPTGRTSTAVVEAYWGSNGAFCVRHRRTWRTKDQLSIPDSDGHPVPVANDAQAIDVAMPEAAQIALTDEARKRLVRAGYRGAEQLSLSVDRAALLPCVGGRPPFEAPWYWTTYPVDHLDGPP